MYKCKEFMYENTTFWAAIQLENGKEAWMIYHVVTDEETLVIPDSFEGIPVTTMDLYFWENRLQSVKKLILGKNLRSFQVPENEFPLLEEIQVPEGSPFCASDYDLQDENGLTIFCFDKVANQADSPSRRVSLFRIFESFPIITDTLIDLGHPVNALVLPPEVKYLEKMVFYSFAPEVLYTSEILQVVEKKSIFPSFADPYDQVKKLVITNPEAKLNLDQLQKYNQLMYIFLPYGNAQYEERDGMLYTDLGKTLAFIPPMHPLLQREFQIPEGVECLGKKLFFHCPRLTSVRMPDTILEIKENAFFQTSNLTTFHLPKSVKRVRKGAFAPVGDIVIRAYEGTAKGLLSSVLFFRDDIVARLEVLSATGELVETIPIPLCPSNVCDQLLSKAWDGPKLCLEPLFDCLPLMDPSASKEELFLLAMKLLDKKSFARYEKYHDRSYKAIGLDLIQRDQEEAFRELLEKVPLTATYRNAFLKACKQNERAHFRPLITQDHRGEG